MKQPLSRCGFDCYHALEGSWMDFEQMWKVTITQQIQRLIYVGNMFQSFPIQDNSHIYILYILLYIYINISIVTVLHYYIVSYDLWFQDFCTCFSVLFSLYWSSRYCRAEVSPRLGRRSSEAALALAVQREIDAGPSDARGVGRRLRYDWRKHLKSV